VVGIPLVVREIGTHRHDVILNVAQVKPNLTARRDLPVLVATIREALDYIRLVA